jgi:hypothetical protein
MTLKQRVIGFGVCTGLGILQLLTNIIGLIISILSFGLLFSIITGNMARFAIPYTFGTLLSLGG